MDIRVYYQKIRQTEAELANEAVVVVSLETSDGGRGGVRTEVSRPTAAKLIVEGKARQASDAEAAEYEAEQREQRRRIEEADAVSKVQVAVLSEADIRAMKANKPPKA